MVLIAILFGFLFANIGVMRVVSKRRLRKYNLLCAHCGLPLVGTAGQIALTTGNCPHCGIALFEPDYAALKNRWAIGGIVDGESMN